MAWCFALIVFSVLCLLVGIVVARRTARSAIWCGGLLAGFALAASLLGPLYLPEGTSPEQFQYVISSLILVASVGANFLAGGICFHLKDKAKHQAPAPAPAPIPASTSTAVVVHPDRATSSASALPIIIIGIGIGAALGHRLASRA